MIAVGLALAPWGVLPWAIGVLAATAWFTVLQRILHVRRELRARRTASTASAKRKKRERSTSYAQGAHTGRSSR